MKKLLCYIALLAIAASGCKKAALLMYSDVARVQLDDTTTVSATFVYDSANVVTDTVFIKVKTIGDITSYDRPVRLEQLTEYTYTLVPDSVYPGIMDTVFTEMPFKALPGVHYIDFNDPSLAKLMVVKAGSAAADIPVVLLRDTSLKTNTYRLRVQLLANSEFGLGERAAREKTIAFSDHLERFYSWRVDNYTATAYLYFGNYSTRKHQFMIDVLKENIDENWFKAALNAGALAQYKNMLREALTGFNNDPANIASGKAPLRETDAPDSPLVTFPN